jgi:hypothetical protein
MNEKNSAASHYIFGKKCALFDTQFSIFSAVFFNFCALERDYVVETEHEDRAIAEGLRSNTERDYVVETEPRRSSDRRGTT